MTLLEQHRQARTVQAVQVETLSPCLRPVEPAPLLTTCRACPPAYDLQSLPLRKQGGRLCESRGAGSAKAGGQAPEDEPVPVITLNGAAGTGITAGYHAGHTSGARPLNPLGGGRKPCHGGPGAG